MEFLLYLSDVMVPLMILGIVAYGALSGQNVYDCFLEGAKKGCATVVKLFPTLIALFVSVALLRASGFLDLLAELVGNVTAHIGIPSQIMPLAIVRLFSSSAATGLLVDLYQEYGTDSRIGLIGSVIMCCTESLFYVMSVYFMSVKVKKTRYTMAGALLATMAGILASVWIVGR